MTNKQLTVEDILKTVYGSDTQAAQTLIDREIIKVRSAVWNWKGAGYFPNRMIPVLAADAAAKGVDLQISDIPVMPLKRAGAG